MAKIRVIKNPQTRQPLISVKGSGLNANHTPKLPAVAVRNPFARATK